MERYYSVYGVERFSATTPKEAAEEYLEWSNAGCLPDVVTIVEWRPREELLEYIAADIGNWICEFVDDALQDNYPEALDPEGEVEFLHSDGQDELRAGMKALMYRVLRRHAHIFDCEEVGCRQYLREDLEADQ
tara:strand:- start:436 stop:834 length:399 start_codon:yes stop_codon:yes gene_type:complete